MVYVVFHLIATSHVHVALSPPVLAVLAGMTAVVLHGKWRRTYALDYALLCFSLTATCSGDLGPSDWLYSSAHALFNGTRMLAKIRESGRYGITKQQRNGKGSEKRKQH